MELHRQEDVYKFLSFLSQHPDKDINFYLDFCESIEDEDLLFYLVDSGRLKLTIKGDK